MWYTTPQLFRRETLSVLVALGVPALVWTLTDFATGPCRPYC